LAVGIVVEDNAAEDPNRCRLWSLW